MKEQKIRATDRIRELYSVTQNMANLSLDFVFGLNPKVNNSIIYINETNVVYSCGHMVVLYNTETRRQEFIKSAESVFKITALAVSHNKRHLAVAEVGEHATIRLSN